MLNFEICTEYRRRQFYVEIYHQIVTSLNMLHHHMSLFLNKLMLGLIQSPRPSLSPKKEKKIKEKQHITTYSMFKKPKCNINHLQLHNCAQFVQQSMLHFLTYDASIDLFHENNSWNHEIHNKKYISASCYNILHKF